MKSATSIAVQTAGIVAQTIRVLYQNVCIYANICTIYKLPVCERVNKVPRIGTRYIGTDPVSISSE